MSAARWDTRDIAEGSLNVLSLGAEVDDHQLPKASTPGKN